MTNDNASLIDDSRTRCLCDVGRDDYLAATAIASVQHFPPTPDSDGTVPLLVYAGDSERTAREHIADTYEADHGSDPQDRADAERWLQEYLAENPGAKSVDVKRAAKKDTGISERTLQRASKKLGVVVGYVGMPAVSVWSLANSVTWSGENGAMVAPPTPVSRGASGATGISPGHTVAPSRATSEDGATVAQQHDQQELPVAPDAPDSREAVALQPPGAPTNQTPGQTERVQQALDQARRKGSAPAGPSPNGATHHGRFTPDPSCFYCDRPVTGKQQDEQGRYAHLNCQRQAEETKR
jgi:hypothetical protein